MVDTAGDDADNQSEGTMSDVERLVTAADSDSGSDDAEPISHESKFDELFLQQNVAK